MKTLAAVLVEQKKPLQLIELEIPRLQPGQVLVQMKYSGLCYSQINEINGIKGEDPYLPHTLGHEGAGVVLKTGTGVTKVKSGDSVVVSWIKGTGLDVPKTTYTSPIGIINSGAISTFMEKAVISENRLVPIPSHIPLKEAALLGCAIPTGSGVVFNDMKIKANQSLVVFGAGGLGLSAVLAANSLGAYPIIVVDLFQEKLCLAQILGASHIVHSASQDVGKEIQGFLGGKGADFSFECAGKKETIELAFCCLNSSGLCVVAGNLPKGQKVEIDPFDLIKGKRIVGTWGGSSKVDEDIPRYADLFIHQKNLLKQLISHEVKIDQINSLIQNLAQGKVARGIISFD